MLLVYSLLMKNFFTSSLLDPQISCNSVKKFDKPSFFSAGALRFLVSFFSAGSESPDKKLQNWLFQGCQRASRFYIFPRGSHFTHNPTRPPARRSLTTCWSLSLRLSKSISIPKKIIMSDVSISWKPTCLNRVTLNVLGAFDFFWISAHALHSRKHTSEMVPSGCLI
jgi:hypothetical protein